MGLDSVRPIWCRGGQKNAFALGNKGRIYKHSTAAYKPSDSGTPNS